MRHTIRIIPRLDIKGPNLVKGVHLEGLRVLGKPDRFASYYCAGGADELIYADVVASLYGRNSLNDIIKKTSENIFLPLTVGGGIRTIEDIRNALLAGADRVSINTAAINNPGFITEASRRFGASTITVSIEAIKIDDGSYEACTDNGRERTGVDAIEWSIKAAELGAGQIVVTSINREGSGKGFDIELTKKISENVSIPVVAHGGAGSVKDVLDVVVKGKADAVCLSSMTHYEFIENNEFSDDFSSEGNVEYIKGGGNGFSKIQTATIGEIKNYLIQNGVSCRHYD